MLKSGVAGYNFGENRAMEFEWDEDKRLANLGKQALISESPKSCSMDDRKFRLQVLDMKSFDL